MEARKIAVIGLGAIGSVISALLIASGHELILIGRPNSHLDRIRKTGLKLRGVFDVQVKPARVCSSVSELAGHQVDRVFITTKTPGLKPLLNELGSVHRPGRVYISAQNGLETEHDIAERFGAQSALRMVLYMGSSIVDDGIVETTFFHSPHHIGCLAEESREEALSVADMLTEAGFETCFTDEIQTVAWKKAIMKSALAPICALADTTLRGCIEYPMARIVSEGGLREGIAVAHAAGIDLPEDFFEQCLDFNLRAGHHKDSMCADIKNRRPTEIDYLNLKIIEHARENGIPTPYLFTTASLVKALETSFLERSA